jgi:hypothetical protein
MNLTLRKQTTICNRPDSALPPLPRLANGGKSELAEILSVMFQPGSEFLRPIFVAILEEAFIEALESSLPYGGIRGLIHPIHDSPPFRPSMTLVEFAFQ